MKRFVLTFVVSIFAAVIAVSCTKDKDMPTEFDIVGQWGVTTVTFVNPGSPSTFMEERRSSGTLGASGR